MGYLGRETDPRAKPEWGAQLDPEHPLALGLYAHWPLLEGTGNVATANLIQGNPLGFLGTAPPAWTTGPDGPAVSMPGTAGNFLRSIGGVFDPSATDFTAEIWFLTTATGITQNLLSLQNGTSLLHLATNNQLNTAVGTTNLNSGLTATVGDWHHAVVTCAAGVLALYLDGVFGASAAKTINSFPGRAFQVGVNSVGNLPLIGAVGRSGVALWTRALGAGEVLRRAREPYLTIAQLATRRFYFNAGDPGTFAATAGPAALVATATVAESAALAATAGPATFAAAATAVVPEQFVSYAVTAGPATFAAQAAIAVAGALAATAGPATFAAAALTTAAGASAALLAATAGPASFAGAAVAVTGPGAALDAIAGPATFTVIAAALGPQYGPATFASTARRVGPDPRRSTAEPR